MTKILLADDHVVLRSGLKLLLESQPDLQVVGEASSGLEALNLAGQLQPDLILLDLSMPNLGGLDALPTLRKTAPAAKILILTMHDDPQYLRTALKLGASGYVLKKAADQELLAAVQSVLRGGVYVHSSMTRILLEDVLADANSIGADAWETLSEREQSVLKMVALGYTGSEIGESLNVSPKTVDTYRLRGMEKLKLSSRAALVRYVLKKGLITGE
ncbi:MAG: response regulator transcription factor [Bacteroidetes bacterium]|nr:response regulator transcription factor [Bacteroidota bacterium]